MVSAILKIHSRNMHMEGVSLEIVSAMTEKATGAELQAICREAGMMAVRREAVSIDMADFTTAVRKVRLDKITDTRMYT